METKAIALFVLIAGLVSADAGDFQTGDAIDFLSNVFGSWTIDWLVNIMPMLAVILVILIFMAFVGLMLLMFKKFR